jgi:hypothetical protein
MDWVKPSYKRSEVDRAGQSLSGRISKQPRTAKDLFGAWFVLGNWRSAHSYPLNHFQNLLRGKAQSVHKSAVIAQRLKRSESIIAKLRIEKHMQLSQMQDIGGCRAIVKNVVQVREIAEKFFDARFPHTLKNSKDYITKPKETGYRGIHLIYRFHSESAQAFNGLQIEIQLRTELQHAWATAVELVGAFTKQALKKSVGDTSWLRFFQLMGAFNAIQEDAPPIPKMPHKLSEIRDELVVLDKTLGLLTTLGAYQAFPEYAQSMMPNSIYFLIETDYEVKNAQVIGFGKHDLSEAQDAYLRVEQRIVSQPNKSAVLVSVDSIKNLVRAYPSYFSNVNLFYGTVLQAIGQVDALNK